jgi:hypothetical protein
MEDLIINYVDAPPGTGKTRACIHFMHQHISEGMGGKKVGYVFYVAPTVDLLKQTIQGLCARVPAHHQAKYIRAVHSGELSMTRDRTEHQVYSILNGKATNALAATPFTDGCVLFLTHATFLKLKKHDKFRHATIIFDESRKWIVRQNLKMDLPGVKDLFDSLFEVRSLEKYSGINELVAKEVPENTKSKLVSTKASAIEFKKLDTLHTSLSRASGPVRMKVYAVMSGKTMIQIMLPSHPFVGFKDVYIMSAAFERSQMYHLFKSEACNLRNRTIAFMNSHSKNGYAVALAAIGERQSKLELVPLLGDEGVPSKYQLTSGVIVPYPNLLELTEKKNEFEITTKAMRDIVAHLNDPMMNSGRLRANHKRLLKEFKRLSVKHNILEWQVRIVELLARKWFAKHGQPHRGLLFVNKKDEDIKFSKKLLTTVSIGKAEGNNGYRKSNLVAFLAAVNPEPEIARVLKALLPNYDPDEDYVIDKAIQCIGRGNIRNHRSQDPMLAIVSTTGMAESISKLMNYAPTIRTDITKHFGDYVTWSANLSRSKEAGSEGRSEKERSRDRQERHKANPLNRKLAAMRTKRSKLRKKGDTEGASKVDLEIAKLLKEREDQRKWGDK